VFCDYLLIYVTFNVFKRFYFASVINKKRQNIMQAFNIQQEALWEKKRKWTNIEPICYRPIMLTNHISLL